MTIGYGATRLRSGELVTASTQAITKQQAEEELHWFLGNVAAEVLALLKVPVTQGQVDALVSFTYNFGREKLRTSKLLRLLNAGDVVGASAEFSRWVKVKRPGGKVEVFPGLVTRRADERRMFESGD